MTEFTQTAVSQVNRRAWLWTSPEFNIVNPHDDPTIPSLPTKEELGNFYNVGCKLMHKGSMDTIRMLFRTRRNLRLKNTGGFNFCTRQKQNLSTIRNCGTLALPR